MQTTLAALAVVAVGYILAYLLFDRLRDRYGYVGGAEYVLIGVILGPKVSGLLGAAQVADLTPIVSLAVGWLGMLLGTYFRLPTLALLPSEHVQIAFAEAVSTFAAALLPLLALFHWVAGFGWPESAVQAVTLAAIATLSSPAAIDALADRARIRSSLLPVLQLTARIDALVAVVAFGLVLAIVHQGDVAPGVRPPTATEWAVINLAIGVATGVLFHLFLGPRGAPEDAEGNSRLFVALAGAIVVASGASYYLNLSPLYTNLVLGFILANTGRSHRDATRLLLATERPVYLALLIFAGAAWSPGSARAVLHRAGLRDGPPRGAVLRGPGRGHARGAPRPPVAGPRARPARAGRDRSRHRPQLHPGVSGPESQDPPHGRAPLHPAVRVRRRAGGERAAG